LVVPDASALVEYLLDPGANAAARSLIEADGTDLHVPSLCDLEVIAAVRRALRDPALGLDVGRAVELIDDYLALPLTRHGHEAFVLRIFELRDNITAYDASYAVLAEALGAELLTADRGLAHAAAQHLNVLVHHV
jgi:predicted nucleic acid-binding protein